MEINNRLGEEECSDKLEGVFTNTKKMSSGILTLIGIDFKKIQMLKFIEGINKFLYSPAAS